LGSKARIDCTSFVVVKELYSTLCRKKIMNAGGKVAMMTMVTATVALQTMIKFDFKIKVK